MTNISAVDGALFHWLNAGGGQVLDSVGVALSDRRFGVAVGMLFVSLLVWALRRAALRPLLALTGAIPIADGIGARVLRPTFARTRPCYALSHDAVHWLSPAANVGSLPSLHAANLFAMAFVVARSDRRLAVPAYLTAVAVAWSRVYVGAHWPSDVLAGAVWGTLAGAISWILVRRALERFSARRHRGNAPS